MRRALVVISVLVVGGFTLRAGTRGCGSESRAPDERLASHFGAICKIADRHVDSPRIGVQKLMRYMGDHSPDMLHDWGELLVLIERIDDDEAHDRRARVAGNRFERVLAPCAEPMAEFGEAVEADPEASRLLQHGVERLNRSLEIILSGGAEQMLGEFRVRLRTALLP